MRSTRYDAIRDDLLKWWRLALPQAQEGIEHAVRDLESAMKQELIPTGNRSSSTRRRRHCTRSLEPIVSSPPFAASKPCVCMPAAHDGRLPATLDEIKEVPIPLNPMTGKPFPYHLEGKTAVLDADGGLTKIPRPQYRVVVAK